MKNTFLIIVLALSGTILHAQTEITTSTPFSQEDVDTYTWPITVSGGTISDPVVVTLSEDIILYQVNHYFIIQSEYVTFEGNNKTITLNFVSDYTGLISNGTNSSSGYSYVNINNIKIFSSASLASEAGWIGQSFFGYSAANVVLDNCYSDGYITSFSGGITGAYSNCTVTRSHTSGDMDNFTGGIFGAYSIVVASNCYSTGNMGTYCGGISGFNCTATVTDCYSTGSIGFSGGGILGYASSGSVTQCYSTGYISELGGGINGGWSYGTVQNCYSTGTVAINGGGIVGEYHQGTITDCYTSGALEPGGSGLVGANDEGTIDNCFAEGNGVWDDVNVSTYLSGTDGTIWMDINWLSDNEPYKISTFNAGLYDPGTESLPNDPIITSPAGNYSTGTYSIISINDMVPTMTPSVSIDAGTGMITFDNSGVGAYTSKIAFIDDADGSYQVNDYTLNILSTLPVTWRSFTVTPRGNTAWLQWSTASEQHSRDFNVQHSINGVNWITIGTIVAAGNSASISNYTYLHADPSGGNNLYRIQQTDLDGKFSYSSIENMQIALTSKSFSVVNTLVSNGKLQVQVKTPVVLNLYGNNGGLIWQKEFNAGLQTIDLGTVSKGVYFLKGKDAVEKILVQ